MDFLNVTEALSLNHIGVQTPLGINECSLSSSKWLSAREVSQTAPGQIMVVDLTRKEATKKSIAAEAAVISPSGNFLAIRRGQRLEAFDVTNSLCIKSAELIGRSTVYWKWARNDVLAIVTETDVIHWSMIDSSEPKVVMSKNVKMTGITLNYRTNEDLKWLMLVTASSFESRVIGSIQLHSVEKSCSQIIEGHAACFIQFKMLKNEEPSELFAFVNYSPVKSEICIAQVGKPKEGEMPYIRKNCLLQIPVGTPGDFPVSLEAVNALSMIFVVWKSAFIALHDVESGFCLYAVPVVSSPVFATVEDANNGILMVNKSASLLSVNVRLDKFLNHLENVNQIGIAAKIVLRQKLESRSNLLLQWFDVLLEEGKCDDAVWLAVNAPNSLLRTPETSEKLRRLTEVTPSPLLTYFKLLIDKTKLFVWESIDLGRLILQQRKLDIMEKLLKEDKLECSEDLGDLLFPLSKKLALSIYVRANVASKAVMCFAEEEQYALLFSYAERMSYKPDLLYIIASFINNLQQEKAFKLALWMTENGKLNNIATEVVGLFIEKGFINQSIQILETMAIKNTPEVSSYQTQLLLLYLQHCPEKAEEILEASSFQFFNTILIAEMCEKVGLWHRALFLHTNLLDLKRVLNNAYLIHYGYIQTYFASIDKSYIVPCLTSMLKLKENVDIAIKAATFSVTRIPTIELIQPFENLKDSLIIFKLLSNIIQIDKDENIQHKYIEFAVEQGQLCDLISVCKTSTSLNPVKTRNFLMGKKMKNPIPLMIICDRFDFVDEMTAFLINSDMDQYFKYFLENINNSRLVIILERALSLGAKDSVILEIISLSNEKNIEDALTAVEKHGRLLILQPWLENIQKGGSKNKALHTALIKIFVLRNDNPEKTLTENDLYDTYQIGMFCSTFNPELSIIAYSKGTHDSELIELCEKNCLVKQMTRYLLHRSNIDLWLKALSSEHIKQEAIVESIAYLVTTESFTSDGICFSVKALMAADLQSLLLKLLETLVFDCPEFADNKSLQNLYILSAMKADRTQVKDLIVRLKNFDVLEVAELARKNGFYEESLLLFQRCEAFDLAMDVILNDIKDLKQAEELAIRCNKAHLWSKLGVSLLDVGNAELAIDAFIKGGDSSHYEAVVKVATDHQMWAKLIEYLEVANASSKEQAIEAELIFIYAKTNMIEKLKKLASKPILVDIKHVAERCFENELLEEASILFDIAGSYSRLAETYALMGNLKDSVVSARKAQNVQCWKTLCYVALSKEDIEVACEAAQYLFTDTDLMDELVMKFEEHDFINEMISTFEKIIASGHVGNAAITNLALLLIRHQPERCRIFFEARCGSLHIPRVLRALEEFHMWYEIAYILERNGDYCEALNVMMKHPTEAWVHLRFKELLTKVAGSRLISSIIQFYLEYKPSLLNDVLINTGARWDATKVISIVSTAGHLSLIKPYLEYRAKEDNIAVNSACCQLFILEGDWMKLRTFLKCQNNFDAPALALQLENNDSVGFRMVSVDLYLRCNRWKDAIRICRSDHLFHEAMMAAELSGDKVLVQEVLLYFLQENKPFDYSALLFKCYDLIDPDLVLELSWNYDVWQFALPYFIQTVHNLTSTISDMKKTIGNKTEAPENITRMITWNPNS